MDIRSIDQEAEEDRQQREEELRSERGSAWDKEFEPGTFGCHELLDRTSVLAASLDQELLAHPSCVRNPAWFALAHQASAALCELYQRIGAEHLSESAPSE